MINPIPDRIGITIEAIVIAGMPAVGADVHRPVTAAARRAALAAVHAAGEAAAVKFLEAVVVDAAPRRHA